MTSGVEATGGRVAAVDVGTNTALLVVAEYLNGRLVPVVHLDRFVRLGESVDRDRRVGQPALDRLSGVLKEFRTVADRHGVQGGIVGATSASRDASNRDRLIETAQDACGWPYEILSGELEARLTFAGAVAGMALPNGDHAVAQEGAVHHVMVDVGGGSTEIVAGSVAPVVRVERAMTADVGSVRITERFFGTVPPAQDAVERALDHVAAALSGPAAVVGTAGRVLGAGGTAVALGALCGVPGRAVGREEVAAWRDRLLGMSAEEVVRLNPDVLTGREDVFAAGVLVFHAAMVAVGASEFMPSPWGLRHGLALRYFGAV